MLKQCKVVMLPTNEAKGDFSKERIYPCLLKHSWMFDENETGKLIYSDSNIRTPTQLQHLYIILDDEIKEDDWCIDSDRNIFQHKNHFPISIGQRKIIATTDDSLGLPQPSQQFIQKYIEAYNKGNIITDVLVEYEYLLDDMVVLPYWKLKVNPKDNTITIKKVKENFTKNEVISLCDDAYKVGYGTAVCEETNQGKEVSFKEWLSTSVLDVEPNKIYTKEEVIRLLEKYTSFIWSEVSIHYPISLGIDAKDKFINNEL